MRFGIERNRGFFGRVAGAVAGAVTASVTVIGALALLAAPAAAGPTPDYGIDFAIIGDPGNRHVNFDEGRRFYPPYAHEGFTVGTVNYKYRMSRTEITVGQWLEFVNAYRPYYQGVVFASEFTSDWIVYDNSLGRYRAIAGSENFAANMGWRYAARFCNWLHNGKVGEQWAFEGGVYDASTFGQDANGNYTDDRTRSADAKFWIPNLDEWTKAMHWDPDKNDGEGGYWRYPTSSDTRPVAGPPGEGDTNAGTGLTYNVGAYGHMSPWGLLDGSGGVSEMLQNGGQNWLYSRGSSWSLSAFADEIDSVGTLFPRSSGNGLRLAMVIPAPGGALLLGTLMTIVARQRRRQFGNR
ncbi:MAG: SUMF1/EgtB/PvdO family nonheme iron enzyme [Phycisphaeraceae bacterium]|nr:SUMF1/EgtB/PvdO family nonheme iron enzyme [Phycisphaeraceae bacterium]